MFTTLCGIVCDLWFIAAGNIVGGIDDRLVECKERIVMLIY